MFDSPEVLLLIGFLFLLSEVKKNFFVPVAGMAYAAWFGLMYVPNSGSYRYLLSGMVILVICACGYTFLISFDKNQ